ncbi:TonB-dependent receptor [uncultured Proteiniphilum sp.]|uniref:TonB-dependent receptor n=1 Tax=uncultured Proteiniphilum sp. TaxID=497637 RepID=UPI002608D469|nr:TonB-dependent receptor [uncultured Proteiniphilum sp.]
MRIILLTIFLIAGVTLNAQLRRMEGRIMDCRSQEGIHLVSVGILGTTKGAISDESGKFVIEEIPEGDYTLAVSSIGYEDKRISVSIPVRNENPVITISLCEKAIDLDQVVVTATRTERLLKNVPIQTQMISAKAIERMQVSTFRDLLEYELPGVEFTNNGGYANINMLGFGGKYVLFLVDGERMAGETFDNIDYNRVDMDNVQQIEIVKGAASSLYGSNAVGGVINIITQKPRKAFETGANVRFGSNNEQNYRYTIGSRRKWGYANLTASFKSMDPYLLKDREPLTQWFANGEKVESPLSETYIAGYKDYSIDPRVGIDLSEKLHIEARGGYYFKERNPGGLDGTKVTDRYYNYSGGLKADYKLSDTRHLLLSGNFDRYDKYEYYKLLSEKEKNYENSQQRFSGLYNVTLPSGHSLVAGAEYFSDNLMTFMFESDGSNAKRDAQTYAVYTQQEWIIEENFTLVTGLRYDYHSQFKDYFTPRLSVMYKLNPKITLRGGYSGGFRSPTLKELYTDWFHPYGGGFQIIGNKDMKAEKSNNLNLSTEISLGKTVVTAMAQYSLIDDMVSTQWVNDDTVRYANIGDAKVLSTELSVTSRITNNLSVKGGYSYVHNNLGRRSLVRPYSATARIDYIIPLFGKYNPTVSFSGKYFSGMNIYGTGDITDTDNESGIEKEVTEEYRVPYDGYAICRLSLAQALPFNLTLNAGVNNLFDYKAKFSSFYSSISPGRTYYVGLKWRL